jgi:hypothetical protein
VAASSVRAPLPERRYSGASRHAICQFLSPRFPGRLAAVVPRAGARDVFRAAAGASYDPVARACPASRLPAHRTLDSARRGQAQGAQPRGPARRRARGQGAHHRARVRAHRCRRAARSRRVPDAASPADRAGDRARGGPRGLQGGAARTPRLDQGGQGGGRDRGAARRPDGRQDPRGGARLAGQGAGPGARRLPHRDARAPRASQGHDGPLAPRPAAARAGRRQGDAPFAAHPDRRPAHRRVRGDHPADRPRRAHAVVVVAGAVLRLGVRALHRGRRRGDQLHPHRPARQSGRGCGLARRAAKRRCRGGAGRGCHRSAFRAVSR